MSVPTPIAMSAPATVDKIWSGWANATTGCSPLTMRAALAVAMTRQASKVEGGRRVFRTVRRRAKRASAATARASGAWGSRGGEAPARCGSESRSESASRLSAPSAASLPREPNAQARARAAKIRRKATGLPWPSNQRAAPARARPRATSDWSSSTTGRAGQAKAPSAPAARPAHADARQSFSSKSIVRTGVGQEPSHGNGNDNNAAGWTRKEKEAAHGAARGIDASTAELEGNSLQGAQDNRLKSVRVRAEHCSFPQPSSPQRWHELRA